MKRLFLLLALAGQGACLPAQTLRMLFTTEVQHNFKGDCNWVNLLRTETSLPLGARSSVELVTLHAAKTARERILPDWQTFSNIELEERLLPCAVAVAGYARSTPRSLFFVGVRNVNEDYFSDPSTALFTNSSNGIFPTLSAGLPLPNYPLSTLSLHYAAEGRRLGWLASLYNGRACNGWRHGDHPFSFHPGRDGLFFIADGLYKETGRGRYHAGVALRYSPCTEADGFSGTADGFCGTVSDGFCRRTDGFRGKVDDFRRDAGDSYRKSAGLYGDSNGSYGENIGGFHGKADSFRRESDGVCRGADGVRRGKEWRARGAWWLYGERNVGRGVTVLAQYSEAFGGGSECRRYGELGCVLETGGEGDRRLGLSCQYAGFSGGGEWSGEVTFRHTLAGCLDWQPYFQLIHNSQGTFSALSLRLTLSLDLFGRASERAGD